MSAFLDHLVVLLPHSTLLSPPSWLTSAFHLYPGGRHADNRTTNTLVLFSDGTYLEFIAFLPSTSPADRAGHRWGAEPEGHVVDYALSVASTPSGSAEDRFAPLRERVAAGSKTIGYTAPSSGGRTQPDGTEIKWAISSAESADTNIGRGELPFFCLDRTERSLRVAYEKPENVRHPSGAKGVAAVDVTVGSAEARDVYGLLQGVDGKDGRDGEKSWVLDAPEESQKSELRVKVAGGEGAAGGKEKIRLTIRTERGTEPRTIGGEVAEGVELWIELKPEA
ncbi:hypothetical protein ACHAQA_005949 [Verticillium albo-atrum]